MAQPFQAVPKNLCKPARQSKSLDFASYFLCLCIFASGQSFRRSYSWTSGQPQIETSAKVPFLSF